LNFPDNYVYIPSDEILYLIHYALFIEYFIAAAGRKR
jgi:hypothetical protein